MFIASVRQHSLFFDYLARLRVLIVFPFSCLYTSNGSRQSGGVLKRGGHTEAAVDLARLAGLKPVGVLCEITTKDGKGMAR